MHQTTERNTNTIVKNVIFKVPYKTIWGRNRSWSWSRSRNQNRNRNSDLRLRGAGAERNVYGLSILLFSIKKFQDDI
jgi:hypothetical protein